MERERYLIEPGSYADIKPKKDLPKKDITKALICVMGTKDTGKTTVLKALISYLCPGIIVPPTVKPNTDLRIIIPYKGKNYYIATLGDTIDIIDLNIEFFRGTINLKNKVFIVDVATKTLKQIDNPVVFHRYPPYLCISATRTAGHFLSKLNKFAKYETQLRVALNIFKEDVSSNPLILRGIINTINLF